MRFPFCAALAASISLILAPIGAGEGSEYFPEYRTAETANGMKVFTAESGEVPLVTLQLIIDAGSTLDPPGREGLSSLAAGMIMKGAGGLDEDQIYRRIESVGGEVSVKPGRDVVVMEGSFISEDLETGVDLLSRALIFPEFSDEDLEREKSSALSDIDSRRYYELATDIFMEAVLPPGYAHPVSGYRETVENINAEDVRDFQRKFYTPDRTTLVITGWFGRAEAVELARKYFGGWEGDGPGDEKMPYRGEQAALETALLIIDQPGITQSEIRIGGPGPGRGTGDYYALTLGNSILGQGRTSRLYRQLREEQGLVYGIRTAAGYFRDAGYFGVFTYTGNDNVREVIDAVLAVLDNFSGGEIGRSELEGAGMYFRGALPFLMETSGDIADRISDIDIFGLERESFAAFADSIDALSSQRVRESVNRHFLSGKRVIVVLTDYSATREQFAGLEPLRVISRREAEGGISN